MKRALSLYGRPRAHPPLPSEPSLVVILGVDRGDHNYAILRDCIRKVIDRLVGRRFRLLVVSQISEKEGSRENGSVEG